LRAQRRARTVDSAGVKGQYRRLTPEQRADHFETLTMLGRLVVMLPTHRAVRRTFVVMSA
jgi:hypothetical protein